MTQRIVCNLLLLLWLPLSVDADPTVQFQVNTYTFSFQDRPAGAADADGDFVVVWHSYGSAGSDSSTTSIQGQRFDSAGDPVGDQFQVNTYTTESQINPAVAMDADGDFIVVWVNGLTSVSNIQGQRFDSAGARVASEFQINTYSTGEQGGPQVAAHPSGGFVVVWHSPGSSGPDDGFSIQGQRFDSAGAPVAGELQINAHTTGSQLSPDVAMDPNGEFVVVWNSDSSNGSDSSSGSVQGQRFDAAGNPIGEQFQANTYTTNSQLHATVATDADGDFVVVWHSYGSSGSDSSLWSIQGQRFNSAGATVGGEFQVNADTAESQTFPSVAMDVFGSFLVAWQSDGSGIPVDHTNIRGQRFDVAGNPVGDEFQVNTYTTGSQSDRAVAFGTDGNIIVAWPSDGSPGTDTSLESVQGRRFDTKIFVDGFESGDTSRWSSSR